MKFRLSTLTLLIAIVAIALGWILDRNRLISQLDRQSLDALSVEAAIAKGSLGNSFVQKHIDLAKGDITEQKFATFTQDTLIESIVVLYEADMLTEKLDIELEAGINFRAYQSERIISEARIAVALLDLPTVKSVDEFKQRRPVLFRKFVTELDIGGNAFDDVFLNFIGVRQLHW